MLCNDCFPTVTPGPTCYFLPASIVQEQLLPDIRHRVSQTRSIIETAVTKKVEAGETEQYPGEFQQVVQFSGGHGSFQGIQKPFTGDVGVLPEADSDPYGLQQYALPAMTMYGGRSNSGEVEDKDKDNDGVVLDQYRGVGFVFSQQEYLFGRLWLSPEDGNCIAFCFYTYGSPDFFAEMRVANAPVCPDLKTLVSSRTTTSPRPGSGINPYTPPLLGYLQALDGLDSDEELQCVYTHCTQPFQQSLLKTAVCSFGNTSILEKLLVSGVVVLNVALFRCLVCADGATAEAVLILLQHTTDEVLTAVGMEEISRYETLQTGLLSGNLDLLQISREMFTSPSVLGNHLAEVSVVNELVQTRGYPAGSTLAGESSEWFRTPLASAALEGYADSVHILLNAGASVDQSIGDDPWNAIVYACFGGCEEVINIFQESFPKHPVWTEDTIPLEMKPLPPMTSLTPPPPQQSGAETTVLRGTVETIRQKANANRVVQPFGGGGGGFPAEISSLGSPFHSLS